MVNTNSKSDSMYIQQREEILTGTQIVEIIIY